MTEAAEGVAAKRAELERLRAAVPGGTRDLDHAQDLDLTYTSNAIEGNLLTAAETALVVEQGVAIGGKKLRDHLEAIDHFAAIGYVRALARRSERISELDLRAIHRLVMLRSAPDMAGRYAGQGRYVVTDRGRHAFPSPAEIPALMRDYAGWLGGELPTPGTAFDAHRRLVAIHPFDDGNGRTARLLMNLLLLSAGYPPITVRPVDRPAYIAALEVAQAGQGTEAFDGLLYGRLDATLDEYIAAARDAGELPTS